MSFQLTVNSKQICLSMPEDILTNILEYDGRWKKEKNIWISIFHMSDDRYWLLDNMIRWQKLNKYCYYNSGRRSYKNADRVGYIFPIIDTQYDSEYDSEYDSTNIYKKNTRYLHINKIIVNDSLFDEENDKTIYKSKFNIIRVFTSKLSFHIDSSDSYCSSDDDHIDGEYNDM